MRATRYFAVLLMGLTLISVAAQPAFAKPKFSSLTVDARTGAVISSEDPDGLRHPASLTKMMTLYIVFQELKAGRIKMSTPLRVSARSAGMAPSKLGLRPGSTITVEQAIKALVIKSANDVAATVGENLGGGNEAAFGQRMTRTARSIGMTRTVFRNASGLPNPAQVTTARDMATLGLRLMRDFPQYYPYFRAKSFTYNGRTIRTHNRLVENFNGTDGIKTGYIGAAGFNLVTSTLRDGKRVVGVVLGAKSSASRNAYMMKIINNAFPKCRKGTTVAAVAGSSKGAINPIGNASEAVADTSANETAATDEKDTDAMAMAAASAGAGDDEDAAEGIADNAGTDNSRLKIVQASAVKPAKKVKSVETNGVESSDNLQVASLPNAWGIQVGSFASKSEAQGAINALRGAAKAEMKNKKAFTVEVKKGSSVFYRVVISGMTERSAKQSCGRATKFGKDCAVILPQG